MAAGDEVFSSDLSFLEEIGIKLEKRRSCSLVETASPCVRKALFHLKNLQSILDRGGTMKVPSKKPECQELRFLHNSDSSEIDCMDKLSFENELVVNKRKELYHLKNYQETPKEVFRQVTELILRLEDDRVMTEKQLKIEKDRLKFLNSRLEGIMIERMVKLPQLVQREHDACAKNLGELDWHINNSSLKKEDSVSLLRGVEAYNIKLKQEITMLEENTPLLKEKLETEKTVLEETKILQEKAEEKLLKANENLLKVKAEYDEEKKIADKEIEICDDELSDIKRQLQNIREDIKNSQLMQTTYGQKTEENEERLAQIHDVYMRLLSEREKREEEEREDLLRLKKLNATLYSLEDKREQLENEIRKIERSSRQVSVKRNKELSELEIKYKENEKKLESIDAKNDSLQKELEKINKENSLVEAEIHQIKEEINNIDEENLKNKDKISRGTISINSLKMKNDSLNVQINKEERETKIVEDDMRKKAQILKREVEKVTKDRSKLEKVKSQNLKMLEKVKAEQQVKETKLNEEYKVHIQELQKAQSELKTAKDQHDAALKVMQKLKEKLDEIETEHKKLEEELGGKKEQLEEVNIQLKKENSDLKHELQEIETETKFLEPEIRNIKGSHEIMESKKVETEMKMKVINKQLNDLESECSGKQKLLDLLQLKLKEAKDRVIRRDKIQKEIMKRRSFVKSSLESGNVEGLEYNEKAARVYKDMQSMDLDIKNNLVKLQEEKFMLDANVSDYKRLVMMQNKLNNSLQNYYDRRSRGNEHSLQNFKLKTIENNKIASQVQKGMNVALDNVEKFLQSHIDGSEERNVKMAGRRTITDDKF